MKNGDDQNCLDPDYISCHLSPEVITYHKVDFSMVGFSTQFMVCT